MSCFRSWIAEMVSKTNLGHSRALLLPWQIDFLSLVLIDGWVYWACLCFCTIHNNVYAKSVLAIAVSPMLRCRHVGVLKELALLYVRVEYKLKWFTVKQSSHVGQVCTTRLIMYVCVNHLSGTGHKWELLSHYVYHNQCNCCRLLLMNIYNKCTFNDECLIKQCINGLGVH